MIHVLIPVLTLILGVAITSNAKEKSIVLTCEGCECRYTFDEDKYSEGQVTNVRDMFIHGPGVLGLPWMMNKANSDFLPYDKIIADIEVEKQNIKKFKDKKIPKDLYKYRDKALLDFDFFLWKSELTAEYVKTKNLSLLRKGYKGRDINKECGVILDFLEGKVKSSDQVISELIKNCRQLGVKSAICDNIPAASGKHLENKNIPQSIYFVWGNCVNRGHKHFESPGDIMKELGIKEEAFDCSD